MFNAISDFFVSNAWAMGASSGEGGDPIMAFAPLIVIFVLFYFMLIRPQQKKQKDVQNMQDSLKKGDKVITSGGIYGLVEQVGEKTVTLKIAENTKVKFGKSHVSEVRISAEDE